MELREEVLDRIISMMSEIKKKEKAIYDKYETSLKKIINNFVVKNTLDLISLIYYDTYFCKDALLNDYVRQIYYEILNIIKINIMKSDIMKSDIMKSDKIKIDKINCIAETVV
jgi:hypothetical protein